MSVLITEAPEALARRAMTRPLSERFDPIVACDERGRYVGCCTPTNSSTCCHASSTKGACDEGFCLRLSRTRLHRHVHRPK
jgi:hypothetical protein